MGTMKRITAELDVSPAEFPQALADVRRRYRLSLADMAHVLGLEGPNSADTVRKMEAGTREPSGPVWKVLYCVIHHGGPDSVTLTLSRADARGLLSCVSEYTDSLSTVSLDPDEMEHLARLDRVRQLLCTALGTD